MASSNGGAIGSGNNRAPQRPRAGTMPSTTHLGLGSPGSSTRQQGTSTPSLDPFGLSGDELLAPAVGSTRPSLLGRRLSGNPLSGASTAASTSSSTEKGTTPSSLFATNASSALASQHIPALSLSLDGSLTPPVHSGSTSMAASTSSSTLPAGSNPPVPAQSSAELPAELRTSLLRSSQPVSPDPVASARLRSGSLTLPPSGLGNGFKPGFYGPPGSGSGTWTPRSTGMGTPLGLPASSVLIPEEHMTAKAGGEAGSATTPVDDQDLPPPDSIGGILDFLNDDSTSPPPPPAELNGGVQMPGHSAYSGMPHSAGNAPRNPSPSAVRAAPLSASLLTVGSAAGPGRGSGNSNGSISVPSSAHPSIQNLRQSYHEQSVSALMQPSLSANALPETSPSAHTELHHNQPNSLSPSAAAARLRANTIAGLGPGEGSASVYRNVSPYLTPNPLSSTHHHYGQTSFDNPSYGDADPTEQLRMQMMSNSIIDEQVDSYPDQGSAFSNSASALYNPNRPRASTIGILDEGSAAPNNRRRAGTAGPGMLGRAPRTPLYEGGANGYLAGDAMAEVEEDAYVGGAQDAWGSQAHEGEHEYQTYTAPVHFGERSSTPPPTQPSRSLWIGNVDNRITTHDLIETFGVYGQVESIRVLLEKECAFVNYHSIGAAIKAKDDILNNLGSLINTRASGYVSIRIGYAKAESAPPTPANKLGVAASTPMTLVSSHMSNGEPSIQTAPTRALWIGSLPSTITSADLLKVFSPYGAIESARVLVHKQCGFVNFESLDEAVAARKALTGQEILGSDVGPVKIGFARVPSRMPETPAFDNAVDPNTAYRALKRLGGATAVPLEEQVSTGHLENFRSPMALQLAANNLRGIGPHSALGLTQSLQPAVGLSPSLVATEFGGGTESPQGVPLPSITEQQVLMKELSDNASEAEKHSQAIAASRSSASYSPIPSLLIDESFHHRNRNLDAPRLRDIRKRLETPISQISQSEIDALAKELSADVVQLASDYIGNVIVQKLFERCSSSVRLELLERVAPHLAPISCHKNGTWAAQKILDIVSSPQEISLVCTNLQCHIPALLLDQFGNYAAQLCLRFFSPVSDFLFDAMIDRCWEIASGRFGARSMRTCLEHPNATRLQQKRVAISVLLNSVNLATNPNGALLLTWLLDTSNLPGRYRLLATRLAPHLSLLCSHKVASTTILKIINQKVDPTSSQMLVDAIFAPSDGSLLEDILGEQVHGSSFMHKLLSSAYLPPATRERVVRLVREVMQKAMPHHSPAYAKLCYEVGLAMPLNANGVPHTPPHNKMGRGSLANAPYQVPMQGYSHPPHSAGHIPHNRNPMSPAFNFPSFGSPISPPPRSAPGVVSPAPQLYLAGQPSPFQAMYNSGQASNDERNSGYGQDPRAYYTGQQSPYQAYPVGQAMGGLASGTKHPQMVPGLSTESHSPHYADQYLQKISALQMSGFSGYPTGFVSAGNPDGSPSIHSSQGHFSQASIYHNGQQRLSPNNPY